MSIKIPEHIKRLKPYIAGKPIEELAREKGLTRIVKLASNENPLGSSPLAIEAAGKAVKHAFRYPDPGCFELSEAISKKYDVSRERLICGAGTDSLLANIITAFTTREDEILTAEGTFIGIYVSIRKLNRQLRLVPLREHRYNLDAMATAITPKTKLIYIANPNNPTGTIVTKNELDSFLDKVPPEILVILDEAYFSYASLYDEYPNGLGYDFPNLIVTRTFSKDYGLAGFRVGFAVGPEELIHELKKVRLPFEPSFPAQRAATASLDDTKFLKRTLKLNSDMMSLMSSELTSAGIPFVGREANFVMMIMPDEQKAMAMNEACLERGLILRHCLSFGIPNGIRMNSGTEDETRFALDCIKEIYNKIVGSDQTTKAATTSKG